MPALPIYHSVPSEVRQCRECARDVWASKRVLASQEWGGFLCMGCMVKAVREDGAKIEPFGSKEAVAEALEIIAPTKERDDA
jgi:hypothetical protein